MGVKACVAALRLRSPAGARQRPARLLNLIGGNLLSVVSFRAEEGLIREIYIVLNPDKLGRVGVPVLGLTPQPE